MNLQRLLQGVDILSSTGGLDKDIAGVASDSRAVEPGYAFVCYDGVNVDGHTFIPQAVQNGATTINWGETATGAARRYLYPNAKRTYRLLGYRGELVRESSGSAETNWYHRHKRKDLNSTFSTFNLQSCRTEVRVYGHGWNQLRKCLCGANDYYA